MTDSTKTDESLRDDIPSALRPFVAAVSRASTVEGVADALIDKALPALNACVAALALLTDDGNEFYCPRIAGYSEDVADRWRRFPASAPLPIAQAVRLDQPVLLETLAERLAFYPPGVQLPPRVGRAVAAIPMRRDDVVGGLGFAFPDDRVFSEGDRAALLLVAKLCAEALGRVRRNGLGCEVLVVEDEPAVLAMLDFALRYHAFAVRKASSGEAAVQIYQQHSANVDVVLMDVQIPGLDGPQTLTALRAINPEVCCVFMSGNTGKYSTEELLAMGAASVLAKPFSSLDEVMRTLRLVARQSRPDK